MEDNPVNFGLEGLLVGLGILTNPVYTDIYFPLNRPSFFGQLKCYDVRVIIMTHVLAIDLQQRFIGTEDIIQGFQFLTLFFENRPNEFFKLRPVFKGRAGILEKEANF